MLDANDEQIDRKFRGKYAPLKPAYETLRDYLLGLGEDVSYYIKTIYIGFEINSQVFVVVYFTDKGLEVGIRIDPPVLKEPFHDAKNLRWPGITSAFYLRDPEDLTAPIRKHLRHTLEIARAEAT